MSIRALKICRHLSVVVYHGDIKVSLSRNQQPVIGAAKDGTYTLMPREYAVGASWMPWLRLQHGFSVRVFRVPMDQGSIIVATGHSPVGVCSVSGDTGKILQKPNVAWLERDQPYLLWCSR